MSFPIVELISQDALATIAAITESAGYVYSLNAQRFMRLPVSPTHLLAVLREDDPESLEYGDNTHLNWRQPYVCAVFAVIPESNEGVAPPYQILNVIRSDIEIALMRDPTRGGNAIDTTIEAPVYADSTEFSAISIHFSVHYRTLFADPYHR